MSKRSLVSVVDDSESVRESLPDLLRHSVLPCRRSRRPKRSSRQTAVNETNCLILDVGCQA